MTTYTFTTEGVAETFEHASDADAIAALRDWVLTGLYGEPLVEATVLRDGEIIHTETFRVPVERVEAPAGDAATEEVLQ